MEQSKFAGPQPYAYIRRSGRELVPLVAVDEIPYMIDLKGIPVIKSWNDPNVVKIGDFPHFGRYKLLNKVANLNDSEESIGFPLGSQGCAGEITFSRSSNEQVKTNMESPKEIGLFNPPKRTIASSIEVPHTSRKEFCHYWIQHGSCAFTQQGCLYKHEMPPLDKLNQIGFREIPAWYTSKMRSKFLTGIAPLQGRFTNMTMKPIPPGQTAVPANDVPKKESVYTLPNQQHTSSVGPTVILEEWASWLDAEGYSQDGDSPNFWGHFPAAKAQWMKLSLAYLRAKENNHSPFPRTSPKKAGTGLKPFPTSSASSPTSPKKMAQRPVSRSRRPSWELPTPPSSPSCNKIEEPLIDLQKPLGDTEPVFTFPKILSSVTAANDISTIRSSVIAGEKTIHELPLRLNKYNVGMANLAQSDARQSKLNEDLTRRVIRRRNRSGRAKAVRTK